MMKILVALILWFPFSIPQDTTPKVVFVNETQEAIGENRGHTKGAIKISKGGELISRVKVRLIIPPKDTTKIVRGITETQ